jgi:hypothetical protein
MVGLGISLWMLPRLLKTHLVGGRSGGELQRSVGRPFILKGWDVIRREPQADLYA